MKVKEPPNTKLVQTSVVWFLLFKRTSGPSSKFFLKFEKTLGSSSRNFFSFDRTTSPVAVPVLHISGLLTFGSLKTSSRWVRFQIGSSFIYLHIAEN